MFKALVKKDLLLLRIYLRSAALSTIGCYLFLGGMAGILAWYQDPGLRTNAARALFTLSGGSTFGLVATAFFAAILAGSVFTLERSDRSAEFLACLPPTRMQNLLSKLTVVLGAIGLMTVLHLITNLIAHTLVPYVPGDDSLNIKNGLSDGLTLATFVAVTVLILGGALAVSTWCNSNGPPTLCGLLTPLLVLSLVSLVGWALDIPSEGNAFTVRFTTSATVLGLVFAYIGCYGYLTRSEP